MKKNVLLMSLMILYAAGMVSAIVILTTKTKQVEEEKSTTAIDTIMSLTSRDKNKNSPTDKIGIIKIDAPISYSSESRDIFMSQSRGTAFWLEQLHFAATNDSIKAVIIQVNSPGGTVGASQELNAAVKRVQAAEKPVITSVADMSASGGYYATVSSDRIFANPGSLVGSIGVIIHGMDFTGILSKIGVSSQTITSGKNKDILSPYKKMTKEQHKLLQELVDNTYEQFVTAVASGRKRSKANIRPLADGSIFTGAQAVRNGLVDELGSFQDAIAYTKTKYELEDAELEFINPTKPQFVFAELISILAPNVAPRISLIDIESDFGYSPVLYLYQF